MAQPKISRLMSRPFLQTDTEGAQALAGGYGGLLTLREGRNEMTVYTKDHPEAGGRKPMAGEHEYKLTFPLQDGTDLHVKCGEETLTRFSDMIGRLLIDNDSEREESNHA